MEFGFSSEGQDLVADVGFVSLTPELRQEMLDRIPA